MMAIEGYGGGKSGVRLISVAIRNAKAKLYMYPAGLFRGSEVEHIMLTYTYLQYVKIK